MNKRSTLLEESLLDPSAIFNSPHDVFVDKRLNDDEKLKILQSWEEDAKALIRAESENMETSPKASVAAELLAEISNIRLELEEMMKETDDS